VQDCTSARRQAARASAYAIGGASRHRLLLAEKTGSRESLMCRAR
jgi:hypothetical protein